MERPTAAAGLALLAGIWILTAVGSWLAFGPDRASSMDGGMGRGMPGHGVIALGRGWVPWVSGLAGAVLVAGGIGILTRPAGTASWGVVMTVGAGANLLLGLGGFVPSTIGIVAGLLAALAPPRP